MRLEGRWEDLEIKVYELGHREPINKDRGTWEPGNYLGENLETRPGGWSQGTWE